MATFNSISALEKYIKNTVSKSMDDISRETENIMREEVERQVYHTYEPFDYERTYALLDSIKTTEQAKDSVEVSWKNDGGWTSYDGRDMYVIHGLEMGKTYGRGGYRPRTNLVEESNRRVKKEIPDVLKDSLRANGVPVK